MYFPCSSAVAASKDYWQPPTSCHQQMSNRNQPVNNKQYPGFYQET